MRVDSWVVVSRRLTKAEIAVSLSLPISPKLDAASIRVDSWVVVSRRLTKAEIAVSLPVPI